MEPLQQPILDASPYVLRPFQNEDAPLIQEVSADPLIPLITTAPSSDGKADALAFIERQHQRLLERSGYSYAIAHKVSNEAVGQIGLWLKDVEDGRANVGYWVADSQREKGIATTALNAISGWTISQPDIHRLELYVEPWNKGSWKTAEKCGFIREGLLRSWQEVGDERRDMYMYSLL